ncbi:MAG: CvpA family protein [Thermoanaerobaculum sp.]
MDAVIVVATCGCALVGAFWGLVRMVTVVAATLAGGLAGRLAGPALAAWLFGPQASSAARIAASLMAGGLAFGLFLTAGAGIRRLLQHLHLSVLDRLLGALATAGLALSASAVLLALAAGTGFSPPTPLAARLTQIGQTFLAAYRPAKSASPTSNPSKPTSRGQHPEDP